MSPSSVPCDPMATQTATQTGSIEAEAQSFRDAFERTRAEIAKAVVGHKEIVDGVLVCSCLVLGVEAEGKAIGTVEGLSDGGTLHPLQRKFIEHAALQCGFCTPGILVAAKALLDQNANPTETEVRYWLAGNLCRCTGYDKIVRAVMDAASEMREAV